MTKGLLLIAVSYTETEPIYHQFGPFAEIHFGRYSVDARDDKNWATSVLTLLEYSDCEYWVQAGTEILHGPDEHYIWLSDLVAVPFEDD